MKLLQPVGMFAILVALNHALPQPSVTPNPPVGVPADAKPFNGKWYRVYLEKGGWKRARDRCAGLRGQLAMVPDEATQVFIRQLANSVVLWLGATDEKAEGQWIWSDGSKMTFTAWDEKQPDGAPKENYLCIGKAGKWHDAFEGGDAQFAGFICEWKGR